MPGGRRRKLLRPLCGGRVGQADDAAELTGKDSIYLR